MFWFRFEVRTQFADDSCLMGDISDLPWFCGDDRISDERAMEVLDLIRSCAASEIGSRRYGGLESVLIVD